MDNRKCIERLEKKGVRATSIRILVLDALMNASRTMSLADLEAVLETVDKSSIFRTLEIFEKKHLVHSSEDDCSIADMHTHFYCEKCHRTFCLKEISAPLVDLPSGFQAHSVNYIIKGICPDCL